MNTILLHALFGVGGGLGALARFWLTLRVTHRFPLSTLLVNVLGCFLLGVGVGWLPIPNGWAEQDMRRLVHGFCGGFTTFSSFAYQSLDLHRRFSILHAAANVVVSLALCLLALWAGLYLGQRMPAA
jgi:CrcB protein